MDRMSGSSGRFGNHCRKRWSQWGGNHHWTRLELDFPGGVGGGANDLIEVDGNLTLNGTVNITDLGGDDEGDYTLITYTGTLTDNGQIIDSLPSGLAGKIDTGTPGEVRLVVTELGDEIFSDRFEES